MEKFQYINIIDLDFLSAVLCYIPYMHPIAVPSLKKFLNSELHLPLRCSDMRLLTRIVLFHIHEGELSEDLSVTLAQSQELLLAKFSKIKFIY